jgi:hypothetical protein
MSIISIDPGKSTGWYTRVFDPAFGVWFEKFGLLDGDDTKNINEFIAKLDPRVDMIIIEDQYGSAKKLRFYRFTWDVLARIHDIKIKDVMPSSWQSHFGLIHRHKKGEKEITKKQKKEPIIELARKLSGLPLEEDACDAYLIYENAIENIPEVAQYA